jgi:hypothetical protein
VPGLAPGVPGLAPGVPGVLTRAAVAIAARTMLLTCLTDA